jgi:galacturan 1,4-alpha-galacturonidase
MRLSTCLAVALLQAAAVLAAPSPSDDVLPRGVASKRPSFAIGPKHPGKPFPASPKRTKTCYVPSYGKGKDDSTNILKSIKQCNNGGHVVFDKGKTYTIGTALDLTFLKHVDLGTLLPWYLFAYRDC